MDDSSKTELHFGRFRINAAKRTLVRDSRLIDLTPKEFDTFLALAEAAGRVVEKQVLIGRVWPDSFVGEGSLARNISVIRKALGEDVIETVPRRGYRLRIPLETVPDIVVPLAGEVVTSRILASAEGSSIPLAAQNEVAGTLGVHDLPSSSWANRIVPSRRWAYAALVVLGAGIVGIFLRTSISQPISVARIESLQSSVRVAVLPFVNYTGTPEKDYLCDGLTEATISELSRLSPGQMSVIARTSAMKFKSTDKAIPEIARELSADYVLESSVRGSGDRLRVTAQLVRGSDASHVWTGEYERSLRTVLDVQQQVAIAVAEEIRLSVDASASRRIHGPHPVDPEAYQYYLLGRFYCNKRSQDGLVKAVAFFQRAIDRDPGYATAYAGLADSYLVLGGGYLPDIETYEKARTAALKAIKLDSMLSDPYASLAYEKFVNEHDMTGADENYQHALTLDPNNATAQHWYALYLSAMKRSDEAILHINRALELDPFAVAIRYNAAWIYLHAERYDEALALAKRALDFDPSSAPAHGTLAVIYESKGLYQLAVAEFRTAQKLRAGYSPYAIEVAHMYALEGKKNRAASLLATFLSDPRWGHVAPYSIAVTYAALGRKDKAFSWLKRSVDDHSCTTNELNNDHDLDSLRSDQRFKKIFQAFNLG